MRTAIKNSLIAGAIILMGMIGLMGAWETFKTIGIAWMVVILFLVLRSVMDSAVSAELRDHIPHTGVMIQSTAWPEPNPVHWPSLEEVQRITVEIEQGDLKSYELLRHYMLSLPSAYTPQQLDILRQLQVANKAARLAQFKYN